MKDFVGELLSKGKRSDGRGLMDYRKMDIEVNPIDQANGSARVRLGKTDILVGVKFGIMEPYPDSPDDGVLMVTAEQHPLASKRFEAGPPSEDSIEFSRVVDRAIRESETIDTSKLVIKSGEKVWAVFVDLFPINDDGNLFDAATLGAMIALKNAVFPKYDAKADKIEHKERTKEKLKLSQVPIMCTFEKLGDTLFLDATQDEEDVSEARLNIATIENGAVCAMQKGRVQGLTEEEVNDAVKEAIAKGKALRKELKKYL